MKKRYSLFVTRYSNENNSVEEEKVLKRSNSRLYINFIFKAKLSDILDFYKKDNVIEVTVYDHIFHKAIARCTYFNNIKRGVKE